MLNALGVVFQGRLTPESQLRTMLLYKVSKTV